MNENNNQNSNYSSFDVVNNNQMNNMNQMNNTNQMNNMNHQRKSNSTNFFKKNLKLIIGIGVGLLVVFIALVILIPIILTVRPKYDNAGSPIYVEKSEINNIYKTPENYKGKFVDIAGMVETAPVTVGKKKAIVIYADPKNYELSTLIYYEGELDVKKDDYVVLTGYVIGKNEFNGEFGSLEYPTITATKIERVII